MVQIQKESENAMEGTEAVKETGTVKWFNDSKGYGFIERDSDKTDVFVHYTAIIGNGYRSLKEEQRVEFRCSKGPKGLQAEDVAKI